MRCLREIQVANDKAVERVLKAKGKRKPSFLDEVPASIACNPVLVKRFVNRPWTAKELGGTPDLRESYRKSSEEPFRKKDVQAENPRE